MLFPGHKYLGPGNDINNEKPIDIDDLIALKHDLEYQTAKSESEILKSDLKAIDDFYIEFLNGNYHALVGAVGLSVKNVFEKHFGVKYPHMAPTSPTISKSTHRGQKRYAEAQRRISNEFKKKKADNPNINYREFVKNYYSTSTKEPSQGEAGPTEISRSSTSEGQQASHSQQQTRILEPGDTMENPMDVGFADEETIAGAQGSSGGGAHATTLGGSMNTVNKKLHISRSIGMKSFTVRMSQSRILYSYGYAFQTLVKKITATNVDVGDNVHHTTPLAVLPNEAIFFYMSPHEYQKLCNDIGGLIKIEHVNVKVYPQGLRTAFDTGSTLSGTATSEHCAIGMTAIGLNNKMYTSHHSYTCSAESPMIPTDVADVSVSDIVEKFWGNEKLSVHGPCCMGVPRHINMYCCLRTNSNRALTRYAAHIEGYYTLDRNIKRFNFTPCIGDEVINWSYKPRSGIIQTKAHDIPFLANESSTCYTTGYGNNFKNDISIQSTKAGTFSIAQKPSQATIACGMQNDDITSYHYSIDNATTFSPNQTMSNGPNLCIPKIYLGLIPTPQLNPSNDNSNFQNSAAYWSIESEIIVSVNLENQYTRGVTVHASNDDIHVIGTRTEPHYDDINPINLVSYGT